MTPAERIRLEEIRDDVIALLDDAAPADSHEIPAWYVVANAELGTREIPGSEHNPRVVEYHSTTGLSADDDETPWCSSFVNWCIEQAGLKGTDSARARSWMDWGRAIDAPTPGCVVVLWRGSPNTRKGHVAFYVGPGSGATIRLLGGNQGNAVSIKAYPKNRVLGYRMPA
jgi:uncharacterized protein (TIGR02594 family)